MSYKVEFSNLHIIPEVFEAKPYLLLKSPNGTTYRLEVTNTGEVYVVENSATRGLIIDNPAGGTAEVVGYFGTEKNIVIPKHFKGMPVTDIATNAFNGKDIVSVHIPDTIVTIGYSSFQDCVNLTGLVLPQTINAIGIQAFYNCKNAFVDDFVMIPASCHISDMCFANSNAKTVYIDYVTTDGVPFAKELEVIYVNSPLDATYTLSVCSNLRDIYVPWDEYSNDEMPTPAPWGAPNATIHFNWNGRIE